MHRQGPIYFLLGALLCLTAAQEWTYEDPAQWGRQFPLCNGNRQSPISLSRRETTRWGAALVSLLDYDQRADGALVNTGETVRLDLDFDNAVSRPRVVLTENGTSTTFLFRSLHFHWPAEHTINDERYPLEMHMVHTTENGRILVLGYLFDRSSLWLPQSNSGMSVIASAVRRVPNMNDTVPISQFAPSRLMQKPFNDLCGFFRYMGSLTTPPCTEGVTWLVRERPLHVERWQLDAFDLVRNEEGEAMRGNFRPLQSRGDRNVAYHRCSLFHK